MSLIAKQIEKQLDNILPMVMARMDMMMPMMIPLIIKVMQEHLVINVKRDEDTIIIKTEFSDTTICEESVYIGRKKK